jgi:hypothetical protein
LGIELNSKDFGFLRRKETLVLSGCLLALAFSQIALEQHPSNFFLGERNSEIQPFLILDHSIFEYLGLFLLVFTTIFLFFHNRSGSGDFWHVFGRQISIPLLMVLAQIFAFLIAALFVRFFIPVLPPAGQGAPAPPVTITIITPEQPVPRPNTSPFDMLADLYKFRYHILIFILVVPLLILIWLQKSSSDDPGVGKDLESTILEDKPYGARTILECYYQASNTLEERGAERSTSLTPTEFRVDVVIKDLTSNSNINGITNLFEEAKFSDHQMSTKAVERAKTYTHEIITIDRIVEEEDEDTENNEGG